MSVPSSGNTASSSLTSEREARQPRKVWGQLSRVWSALQQDNISIMAAGTAYYAMLSIFPAMSATVLTYGLIADPMTIEHHVDALAGVLPEQALKLLSDQLHALVTAARGELGLGLLVSVLFALWTATSGMTAMMGALTAAYEGEEKRGVLRFYGTAVALTVASALFGLIALLLIAGVPAAVAHLPLPELWTRLLPLLRWPILALVAVLGLGTLYRFAPSRDPAEWNLMRVGTVLVSLLWLAGSAGFSFYASYFGSYDRTYGPLGAVVVLLVWLYVTAYVILAGAELNREIGRSEP